MISADEPADDAQRVATLRALEILDTPAEERFDRITRLAQRLFGAPIALMSLVDEDRQWFKSRQGLDDPETSRDTSFCAHAILDDEVMVVSDAMTDPRFVDNPYVTGNPNIRFYAGAPIEAPNGAKLGTLCVIDRKPRTLSDEDAQMLRDLAEMAEKEIAALHMAATDELTGLLNRRGFTHQGERVLEICRHNQLPATVLYLDLNGFKSINDRFGHDEGDRALQTAARLLRETLRASDVSGRLGGDEFAALLPGAAGGQAALAIERLRKGASEHRPRDAYELSFSAGAASRDQDDDADLEKLLHRADAVMYEQKRSSQGSRV